MFRIVRAHSTMRDERKRIAGHASVGLKNQAGGGCLAYALRLKMDLSATCLLDLQHWSCDEKKNSPRITRRARREMEVFAEKFEIQDSLFDVHDSNSFLAGPTPSNSPLPRGRAACAQRVCCAIARNAQHSLGPWKSLKCCAPGSSAQRACCAQLVSDRRRARGERRCDACY